MVGRAGEAGTVSGGTQCRSGCVGRGSEADGHRDMGMPGCCRLAAMAIVDTDGNFRRRRDDGCRLVFHPWRRRHRLADGRPRVPLRLDALRILGGVLGWARTRARGQKQIKHNGLVLRRALNPLKPGFGRTIAPGTGSISCTSYRLQAWAQQRCRNALVSCKSMRQAADQQDQLALVCANRASRPFRISIGAGGQPEILRSTGITAETGPAHA